MRRSLALLLIPALLPAAASAQSVLRVGPNRAFTEIFAATMAAQPGDVVLVDTGGYRNFNATQSITIRADPVGAFVEVAAPSMLTSVSPGVGEHIIMEGLTFAGEVDVFGPGNASFTRTVFRHALSTGGDSSVALTGCQLIAPDTLPVGRPALIAVGTSTVSAVQTSFDGGTHFFVGTPGIAASQSAQLHLSSCSVVGGVESRLHHFVPNSGMVLRDAARAWIVDCDVSGYPFSNFGGIPSGRAIINLGTEPVIFERCNITTGSMPPVLAATTGIVTPGFLLGISTPTTHLQRGAPMQIDFRTRPSLPVVMHTALELGPATFHPLLSQPEWGFSTNTIYFAFMLADVNGFASTSLTIPNIPAALNRSFWFTGWSAMGLPAQLSPTFGGVVH